MNVLFAVMLSLVSLSGEIKLEAETAGLTGVLVDTARAGYSGTGYITGFDAPTDSITFQFQAEAGLYELRLVTAFTGNKRYEVHVNDEEKTGTLIRGTNEFADRSLGLFKLVEGENQVLLVNGSGLDVDYIRLVPVVYPLPAVPPPTLTDPQATASTRSLLAFLIDVYGK